MKIPIEGQGLKKKLILALRVVQTIKKSSYLLFGLLWEN